MTRSGLLVASFAVLFAGGVHCSTVTLTFSDGNEVEGAIDFFNALPGYSFVVKVASVRKLDNSAEDVVAALAGGADTLVFPDGVEYKLNKEKTKVASNGYTRQRFESAVDGTAAIVGYKRGEDGAAEGIFMSQQTAAGGVHLKVAPAELAALAGGGLEAGDLLWVEIKVVMPKNSIPIKFGKPRPKP